jgi:hypothetical protein
MKRILLFEQFINEAQEKAVFTLGDRDAALKPYQLILKSLGYNLGTSGDTKDGVDGDFGQLTKAATKDFQGKNGLEDDGSIGPLTKAALAKAAAGLKSSGKAVPALQGIDKLIQQRMNPIDTFSPYSRDTVAQKYKWLGNSVAAAIKMMGSISERTFEQLADIAKSKALDGKSFIIINKDAAIAALFDADHKLAAKSAIATGRTQDPGVGIGKEDYEEWANRSLAWGKDPNVIKWAKANPDLVKPDGKIDWPKYSSIGRERGEFPYSFAMRTATGTDWTPSGMYGLAGGFKKNYAGAPDIINTYPLINLKTDQQSPVAVHAYANPNRISVAGRAAGEDPEIPKPYTRVGAGCVNVDRNFLLAMQKHNPRAVVILPDAGGKVDVTAVSIETWTEKMFSLGDRIVQSLSNLF